MKSIDSKTKLSATAKLRTRPLGCLIAFLYSSLCLLQGVADGLILGVSIGGRQDQLLEESWIARSGQLGVFELYYQVGDKEVAGLQVDIERPSVLPSGVVVGRFQSGLDSGVLAENRVIEPDADTTALWRERVVLASERGSLGPPGTLIKLGEIHFRTDFDSPSASLVLNFRNIIWSDFLGNSLRGEEVTETLSVEAPELFIPPLPVPIVPSVAPVFTGIQVDGRGAEVRVEAVLGQPMTLEFSSDLINWEMLTEFDGSVREWSFIDTSSSGSAPLPRFYRLVTVGD